jgi:uncharacterized RDD family membrane protein YckC
MSDFEFNCPHCTQSLEAPDDMSGQLIDCPKCKAPIEVPFRPNPAVAGGGVSLGCPLCGKGKYMNDKYTIYGHAVCKKCYHSFASRRQFAYLLDILICYTIWTVIFIGIGGVMDGNGSSKIEADGIMSFIEWTAIILFMFKDCWDGQSIGKAICGVTAIDEITGKPGGIEVSLKRNLPLLIPIMPIIAANQLCKGHRIGDGWANTKVIWDRYANHPIFMPGRLTK